MADISVGPATNGNGASVPRPMAAPAPTGSPSGIRGPRIIMQERQAREARRAEQERLQREQRERQQMEEARRREAERQTRAAGAATASGEPSQRRQTIGEQGRTSRSQPATMPAPLRTRANTAGEGYDGAQPQTGEPSRAGGAQPGKISFPHAFERWELMSAHWEGLTSSWIRKLEQNAAEIERDPVSVQLSRQVTDLSAAGANLFRAVVELQRLRACSERKFHRWFFETRFDLEQLKEKNGMLQAALDQERANQDGRIQAALQSEQHNSRTHKQLSEMKKELGISKEEARRAWDELGRREQEERDRVANLQAGRPVIIGGVQVVPMTQGVPSRHGSQREPGRLEFSEYSQAPPLPTTTSVGARGYYAQSGPEGSEGGFSEEDYDDPASYPPQSTYTTSGPDYSGQGYGSASDAPRHHHPTRLSDVPEEDERSRTSASALSRGNP